MMKINDTIKQATGLETDKLINSASSKKSEKAEVGTAAKATVTISTLSSQLQSLEASQSAADVFDTEKVDAIKSAIASGQFKVDSEKVADGLIASVKDLLASRKP